MTHVLIVNSNGTLSAMPTIAEFQANEYVTEDTTYGMVHCDADVAAMIFQERQRIRVLAPGLPGPTSEIQSLYIGVVEGRVTLC